MRAEISGAPALAFGNVIGASRANLLIVLPLAALLLPFRISRAAIASEGAAAAAAAAMFAGLAFLPALARASGVVFLLLLALWLFVSLRHSARSRAAEAALQKREAMVVAVTAPWWKHCCCCSPAYWRLCWALIFLSAGRRAWRSGWGSARMCWA